MKNNIAALCRGAATLNLLVAQTHPAVKFAVAFSPPAAVDFLF
jgi:hypothetical protein